MEFKIKEYNEETGRIIYKCKCGETVTGLKDKVNECYTCGIKVRFKVNIEIEEIKWTKL